jgi:hypothetical protein
MPLTGHLRRLPEFDPVLMDHAVPLLTAAPVGGYAAFSAWAARVVGGDTAGQSLAG